MNFLQTVEGWLPWVGIEGLVAIYLFFGWRAGMFDGLGAWMWKRVRGLLLPRRLFTMFYFLAWTVAAQKPDTQQRLLRLAMGEPFSQVYAEPAGTDIGEGSAVSGLEYPTNFPPVTNLTFWGFKTTGTSELFGVAWPCGTAFANGSVDVFGNWRLGPTGWINFAELNISAAQSNAVFETFWNAALTNAVADGVYPTNATATAAFFRLADQTDTDGDGLTDAEEKLWYGTNPALADTDGDGFPDGVEVMGGIDPLSGCDEVITNYDGSVAYAVFPSIEFALTNSPAGAVFSRTFAVGRETPWKQFFLSSSPYFGGGWNAYGLSGCYSDSNGTTNAIPSGSVGDSVRLVLSTNAISSVTVEFDQTSGQMYFDQPLCLIEYSPDVYFPYLPSSVLPDGTTVFVATGCEDISVWVDRWSRPHYSGISDEELNASPFTSPAVRWDGTNSLASVPCPGAYDLWTGDRLYVIDPVLEYRCGHRSASGDWLLWRGGHYVETNEYPVGTGCIREDWRRSESGALPCSGCELYFDPGIEGFPCTTTVEENGLSATATVLVGGTPVWEGTATHSYGGGSWDLSRVLSSDPCEECGGGCAGGDCDWSEGPSINSVSFRLPLGFPRSGRIDGFLWFESDSVFTPTVGSFNLKTRPGAAVSDAYADGVRRVRSEGARGRDVAISAIPDGVRLVVTNSWEGMLSHTWEITRGQDGLRFRKISRADNTLSDETFAARPGGWARMDNVSGLVETETRGGSFDSGAVTVTNVQTDASGLVLSETVVVKSRIGEGSSAVVRETERREKTASGWNVSSADYWNEPGNRAVHGLPKLVRGTDREWTYTAYDARGRETLRLAQIDGSECPADMLLDCLPRDIYDLWFDVNCTATVSDYTPLPGDSSATEDADTPRTVTEYETVDGIWPLVAKTWTVITRGTSGGFATKTVTTTRACSQEAEFGDEGNAVSTVTVFDPDAEGVPFALRGKTLSETDEDGKTTEYSYTFGSWDSSTRTFAPGGASALRTVVAKSFNGVPDVLSEMTVTDAAFGHELYRESRAAVDGADRAFGWRSYLYDTRNRLVSTIYDDGTSDTNAYSCCRLLWKRDRDGFRTLRSATTGTDRLYYAMEEVSMRELPHDDMYAPFSPFQDADKALYRVTLHFMDEIGRETNTVVRCSKFDGFADNPSSIIGRGWRSTNTTEYVFGTSDYSMNTDERGLVTVSEDHEYADRTETIVSTYLSVSATNAVKSVTSVRWRNGRSEQTVSWGTNWTTTASWDSRDEDGNLVSYRTTSSTDCGPATNSVTTRDFLGRTVRVVTPTSDVEYSYDGASSRMVSAEDSVSGIVVTNLYDIHGESVGELRGGIASVSETSYEVFSNILWRTTAESVYGSVTGSFNVVKERLTGLSDELRSETATYANGALVEHSVSSYDPSNAVVVGVNESALSGTATNIVRFGRILETRASDGTTSHFFDPYGRVFYTEHDGRSVDWIGRNAAGDIERHGTFHAHKIAYGEFSGYDAFGNRIAVTNALGDVTTHGYDAQNRLVESGGATYPVRYGYDAQGRRTSLSTTRGGLEWDETRWSYDSETGLCTAKTYADGSTVVHAYTPDGKPLRTTYASGRWKECAYNAKRELESVAYSDGECERFAYDEFSNLTSVSNSAAMSGFRRDDRGRVTNETQTVGSESLGFVREYDSYGRLVRDSHASYFYADDGKLLRVSNQLAVVEYSYSPDRLDAGYTVTLPNGMVFERSLRRDAYRRSLVASITNRVNGAAVDTLAYAYDALNRPTSRNADTFGYNARSEVTQATVGGYGCAYSYDEIGNSTFWTANSLNQYADEWWCDENGVMRQAFAYDADGNMTVCWEKSLSYDAGGRLKSLSTNGLVVATSDYDAKSRRVRKTTSEATHTFFYDEWNLIEERIAYTNGTTSIIHYYWGKDLSGTMQGAGGVGGLLYLTIDNALYIPCYDNNGNVTHYLDASGNVVAQYAYDAFGGLASRSGSLADTFRFRFSTKYYDPETSLYYYGYRYYSTIFMRWISRDPIGVNGGINSYCMCKNDPIEQVDLLGNVSLRYYARQATGFWESLLTGKKSKEVSVSSAEEIPVELKSLNKHGVFIACPPSVTSCEISILIQLMLDVDLEKNPKRGSVYKVILHTSDMKGGITPSKDGRKPPLMSVLAHERGHAKAFFGYTKPSFEKSIKAYIAKKELNETDEADIKQRLKKARKENEAHSARLANEEELKWYRQNGYKERKEGETYVFTKE